VKGATRQKREEKQVVKSVWIGNRLTAFDFRDYERRDHKAKKRKKSKEKIEEPGAIRKGSKANRQKGLTVRVQKMRLRKKGE